MSKKSIILFVFVVAWGLGFSTAKTQLKFEGHAKNFLKKRTVLTGHRMGFLNSNSKKDALKSYVVKIDSTRMLQSMLELLMEKKFFVKKGRSKELKFTAKGSLVINTKGLAENSFHFGEKIAKWILPNAFAQQFDFFSVDEEESFNGETFEKEVTGYIFNFQRVYNNRIVRSENNYLNIAIDAQGRFKWAEISMEDLSLTREIVYTTETAQENENTLDSIVNISYSTFYSENFEDSVAVESVNVESAAEAYCEIEDENVRKFYPCLSYSSNIILKNGTEISTVIDAPHSLSDWKNYKNRRRNKILFAYNADESQTVFSDYQF